MKQGNCPFADVFELLRYVKKCHPRFDDNDASKITRLLFWASRCFAWASAIFISSAFAYGFDVGSVAPLNTENKEIMHQLVWIGFGCLGLFSLFWRWEDRRSFPPATGRAWEILARRADRRAREILLRSKCNVPLLTYAKDILKEDANGLERSAGSIGKDVGLLALGAVTFSVVKGWIDFKTYVLNAHWAGVNGANLVFAVAVVLGYAGLALALALLFGRALANRVRYQIGLIDAALRLKELDEEMEKRKGSEIQAPADNG